MKIILNKWDRTKIGATHPVVILLGRITMVKEANVNSFVILFFLFQLIFMFLCLNAWKIKYLPLNFLYSIHLKTPCITLFIK